MKISVITPSYNQGRFLERTIKSVLSQDYDQCEFIIMDGGSTDNSLDVITKYSKSIDHYESRPDGGQTHAVNKGINRSTGEIIGWLNSDDVYYPGTLSAVADIFQKYPEVNVIYGQADHIDENDGFIEEYKTEPWDYEKLKNICFICQPAVFFRKAVTNEYGMLDESLDFCMDYEYWLRLGQYERFHFFQQKLAGSRLYASNKTLGSSLKVHAEIVGMFKTKFGKAPSRWLAALAHFKAIEGNGVPVGGWEIRMYLLKAAFYWNRDLLLVNKQVMPKELLLDVLSILKGSSTAFNNRLAISQKQ